MIAYKDAADKKRVSAKLGSEGYPPDMDTLVNGVELPAEKSSFSAPHPGGPYDRQTLIGACAQCRTIRSQTRGADRTFLMVHKVDPALA